MIAPAPAPKYSCLLPLSLTVLTDVEDFLTQLEAVSTLSNWFVVSHDLRPHLFCAQFTGDGLTSYRSPINAQKSSLDGLQCLSGSNTNQRFTFWRPKLRPFANYPAKICPFLTGDSVSLPETLIPTTLRNELLLTTFIQGLADSVLQWKLRKAKPGVVEDAVSLSLEMQSYLNLHFTANSRTLPWCLLTFWPVHRRSEVNSFPF